jgi:hypothetical protein
VYVGGAAVYHFLAFHILSLHSIKTRTPEICDLTAMGLPPVTSAVFLIAILVKRGRLGGIF